MITQPIVVVHQPHQTTVIPFSSKRKAEEYFKKILKECVQRYGPTDIHGADFFIANEFKFFQITEQYYIQLYEGVLDNSEEVIQWI